MKVALSRNRYTRRRGALFVEYSLSLSTLALSLFLYPSSLFSSHLRFPPIRDHLERPCRTITLIASLPLHPFSPLLSSSLLSPPSLSLSQSLTRTHTYTHVPPSLRPSAAVRDRGATGCSDLAENTRGTETRGYHLAHTTLGSTPRHGDHHRIESLPWVRREARGPRGTYRVFPRSRQNWTTSSTTKSRFRCPPDAVTQRFYKHP